MLIAAALLIQTLLIVGLFYEHRRRRGAEASSRSAMGKLAHMNRIATASELTASIAHEINQPPPSSATAIVDGNMSMPAKAAAAKPPMWFAIDRCFIVTPLTDRYLLIPSNAECVFQCSLTGVVTPTFG